MSRRSALDALVSMSIAAYFRDRELTSSDTFKIDIQIPSAPWPQHVYLQDVAGPARCASPAWTTILTDRDDILGEGPHKAIRLPRAMYEGIGYDCSESSDGGRALAVAVPSRPGGAGSADTGGVQSSAGSTDAGTDEEAASSNGVEPT